MKEQRRNYLTELLNDKMVKQMTLFIIIIGLLPLTFTYMLMSPEVTS